MKKAQPENFRMCFCALFPRAISQVDMLVYAGKCRIFICSLFICSHHECVAVQILDTDKATYIKELGGFVSNYDYNRWNVVWQFVVYEGILAKFS